MPIRIPNCIATTSGEECGEALTLDLSIRSQVK